MKFNAGDRVGQSTLYVEDTHYNKIVCRCQKCLTSAVYKEEDLTEYAVCKVCNGIMLARECIKPTVEMKTASSLIKNSRMGKYRNNTNSITTAMVYKDIHVGETLEDMTIAGFVGKANKKGTGVSFETPTQAVLLCKYCNYYSRIIDLEKLYDYKKTGEGLDLHCPHCSEIIKKAALEVKELSKNRVAHSQKMIARSNDKRAEAVREDGTSQLIQKAKSPLDNVKAGSKLQALLDKVKESNKNMNIQDVEVSGSSYKVACTCEKCGTEVIIPSTKRSKQVDCPGCERLKTDLNYVGAYNKDYTGTAKNLMELVERKDDMCTVKCNSCGRVYDNIKFYQWYKGKVICDCENNQLRDEVICNNCGEYMTIPLKDVVGKADNTKQIICNKCKKESGISLQEIIDDYIEAPSVAITTSNKLGVARNKIKSSTDLINGTIVKDKNPLYIGTDGNMYYKCTCLMHNTDMILNDDEVSMFNHEQCTDVRQHIMEDLTKDKISL